MWTLIFLLLMIAVFGKLIFFAVKMDMGSYENSVYPRIFSADSYRTGDGRTYVYCTADFAGCGNHYMVCEDCVLKKTVISIQIWRFFVDNG